MKDHTYRCPQCGSAATKRCQTLYEQSLTDGPQFTTERRFAQRAAPPTLPSLVPPIACSVFACIAIGSKEIILSLIAVAVSAWLWQRSSRAKPEYKRDLELYRLLWICTDCAKVFKPEPA